MHTSWRRWSGRGHSDSYTLRTYRRPLDSTMEIATTLTGSNGNHIRGHNPSRRTSVATARRQIAMVDEIVAGRGALDCSYRGN